MCGFLFCFACLLFVSFSLVFRCCFWLFVCFVFVLFVCCFNFCCFFVFVFFMCVFCCCGFFCFFFFLFFFFFFFWGGYVLFVFVWGFVWGLFCLVFLGKALHIVNRFTYVLAHKQNNISHGVSSRLLNELASTSPTRRGLLAVLIIISAMNKISLANTESVQTVS